MNFLCRTQAYLKSVSATVNALSGMICSDELKGNAETQYKIAIAMIELEQATADFIVGTELDSVASQSVAVSKRRFISSNERVIAHLEKIQLQGYHFDELTTSLKLENDTLKKETEFLSSSYKSVSQKSVDVNTS